jgi:ATP-binding cassette subfamily C (CFTR/MRP) protein 4
MSKVQKFLAAVREEEERCGSAIEDSSSSSRSSSPKREPCPLDTASFVGRISFSWVSPLVYAGARSPVEEPQLWDVSWRDSAAYLRASVVAAWRLEEAAFSSAKQQQQQQQSQQSPRARSLLRATLRAFRTHRAAGLLLPCISFVKVSQAFALGRLIERMASGDRDRDGGGVGGGAEGEAVWFWDTTWGLSTTLVLLGFVTFQLWHQYFLRGWRVGMQLRTAMVATIYHKALRLSLAALGRVTVGNVVNLATNDSKSLGHQSRHLSIPNPWNAHTTAPPSSLARSLHFLGRPT